MSKSKFHLIFFNSYFLSGKILIFIFHENERKKNVNWKKFTRATTIRLYTIERQSLTDRISGLEREASCEIDKSTKR